MDPRQIVTETAFRIHPDLLGVDLASPWRRFGALLVDLTIAGLVSALGGAGLMASVAAIGMYRMVTRASGSWFRSMAGSLLAFVVWVAAFAILSSAGGDGQRKVSIVVETDGDSTTTASVSEVMKTLTRNALFATMGTDPSQTATAAEAIADAIGKLSEVVEDATADNSLVGRIAELEKENKGLRNQVDRPSLIRIIRGAADDLGLTIGWVGLYFTFFVAWWRGSTPGKRLFNIRIYRLDGEPLTLWGSFERFAGYATGLATGLTGFAQVFWDPNRQCIHDRISSTVVVRMAGPDEPRRDWVASHEVEPAKSDRST